MSKSGSLKYAFLETKDNWLDIKDPDENKTSNESPKSTDNRIISTYMIYGIPVALSAHEAKPSELLTFHKIGGSVSTPNFVDELRTSYLARQKLYGNKGIEINKLLNEWLKFEKI